MEVFVGLHPSQKPGDFLWEHCGKTLTTICVWGGGVLGRTPEDTETCGGCHSWEQPDGWQQ